MRDLRLVTLCSLAVPLCAVTTCMTVIVVAEWAGGAVLTARPPTNLAEAAASGRADLVFRMLRSGEPAAAVYDVHPDVISSAVRRATALEAAIWSRQLELIELFDREGAIPVDVRRQLVCLADDLVVADVVEYLGPAEPPCVPEQAMNAVIARTHGGEDAR